MGPAKGEGLGMLEKFQEGSGGLCKRGVLHKPRGSEHDLEGPPTGFTG